MSIVTLYWLYPKSDGTISGWTFQASSRVAAECRLAARSPDWLQAIYLVAFAEPAISLFLELTESALIPRR